MNFNEAVKKHKNKLIENLAKFHEGHRLNGMLRDIDSSSSDYEYYFKAGVASRQAEIDGLQKLIKAMQKTAQRIMIAIDDDEIEYARRSACKIFKGESNE